MLSIDDDSCIECGICADLLPQYFEVVRGGVRVRAAAARRSAAGLDAAAWPDAADAEAIAAAIRDCPSGSLRS